jgi:hypothetical protein
VKGKADEKRERSPTLAGLRESRRDSGVLALAELPSAGGGEKEGDPAVRRSKSIDSWFDNKRLCQSDQILETRRIIEYDTHLRAPCRSKESRHSMLGDRKCPESVDDLSSIRP